MNAPLKYYLSALCALALCAASVRADLVYVTCADGTIQKFSANGVGSLVGSNAYGGAFGVDLDDEGNLYVSDGQSRIFKYLPDGTQSETGFFDSPQGLAFNSLGELYVTCPNWVVLYKPFCNDGFYSFVGSNVYIRCPATTTNLSYPVDLTFDSTGNIYVANGAYPGWSEGPTNINTIEMFSPDLTPLGSFARGLNNPRGVIFDDEGFLYVANSGDNTILWFLPDGESNLFASASSGLSDPRGLAFDSQGLLYVANYGNGTIARYTPEGIGTVFASGLDSPRSIAIFPGSTPPNIVLSSTNTEENQPVGTMVGALSTQADADYTSFSYSLVAGAGSDDNSSFTIAGSNLLAGVVFNHEVKSNYSVRVQSNEQGGLSTQKVFTINILNVDEPEPSFTDNPVLSISNVVLRWSSITNKQYTVHYSTNLLTGFSVLQSNVPATPTINSYTDSFISVTQKYWKITTDP